MQTNQTELEIKAGSANESQELNKFFNSPLLHIFIFDLPILSFVVANFIIFYIINRFWRFNIITSSLIFICGLILSFIIVKNYYFLDIREIIDRTKAAVGFVYNYRSSSDLMAPKVYFSEAFSFLTRNIFFNILNDLFILLIFWIAVFGSSIYLGFAEVPSNFQLFSEVFSLIGIISGLFQFYVKDYKDKMVGIIDSFVKDRFKETKRVSFKDFRQYLLEKHKNQLVTSIDNILKHKSVVSQTAILEYGIKHDRRTSPIYQDYHLLPRPIDLNTIQAFSDFEVYLTSHPEFNKRELFFQYEDYLRSKRAKIKEENFGKAKEFRRVLLTTIIFSDEIIFSYLRLFTDVPQKVSNTQKFSDFYSNYLANCLYDFYNDVLFLNSTPDETRAYYKRLIETSSPIVGLIILSGIILTPIIF